eukprot:CAMPEP_0185032648 /NCGR_PEP_ID=MMETSP1103-20130426/20895_1 /TAXON_ID=36769 /ORGANISM="Paraphysomonas bandaiensis, Strain Caron Lab Isolate" /LENGTH=1029 /DNA_ID=CAMNT_0027568623 /DNA_START=299 /DNA_END=3388 /DNA_ORIENTATION=+
MTVQPVFSGWQQQRVCYCLEKKNTTPTELFDDLYHPDYDFTIIPHALKLDDSIDTLTDEDSSYVLEVAMGVGVRSMGLMSDHVKKGTDLVSYAKRLRLNTEDLVAHWERFFWTSPASMRNLPSEILHHRRDRYLRTVDESCDFSKLEVSVGSRSHVHIISHGGVSHHCMRYVASVAALHDGVSHVSAYKGYALMETSSTNVDITKENATDQNAWLQSGTHTDTPYSDLGMDGEGYVLGMIDSGVDDLSCFLIDDSHEQTTRTTRNMASTPVTEDFRRKVIQYIAWADGEPDETYDHGTWCSGASVGKCINPKKHPRAPEYNGLSTGAKLTMFDVQSNNKMFVPSLYHIALPPAYAAGARVHSDSWGCRGITSYTSKALDVDEFMFENPDFLFVVAAGNDGALGMDSVGSPGVSKSALTVGASAENHNDIVYFSGIGQAFNGIIKPDVIGPGTNLMSTGVSNDGKESCNVQISSGTSMATPLIASTALLVRQYLEDEEYWGSFCNSTYRSCPHVDRKHSEVKHIVSAPLVKAILVHSATDMKQTLSIASFSQLPTRNLTEPPDRFQGWGQVILKNVLPIPGLYDHDLYIADNEGISEMTRRTYTVVVEHNDFDLKASVAWNDPPNVVWAAKNLLNDLDLMIISPTGEVFYGNNRRGDEFNAMEKVVIHKAPKGEYTVHVTCKKLHVLEEQLYSLVITSAGYVAEEKTSTVSITAEDINYDDDTLSCVAQKGKLIRFQLEDWMVGYSWHDVFFTISKGQTTDRNIGETVYIRTFISNHDRQDSKTNRIDRFSVCLQPRQHYVARINNLASATQTSTANVKYIRVASPDCNMFLSTFWLQDDIYITSEEVCNQCPSGSTLVQVLMFANVTDDDFKGYSWYGDAYYELISTHTQELVASGTLVVSDEQADRVCIPHGKYVLKLYDEELYKENGKHAAIRLTADGIDIAMQGTHETTFQLGPPSFLDPVSRWYMKIGFYFLVGAVIAILIGTCVRWRTQAPRTPSGSIAGESSPLLDSRGSTRSQRSAMEMSNA